VTIERPEALSLLRKWTEESSLLHCTVTFKTLGIGMDVRILSLSDEFVTARSDDGRSTIRVAIDLAVAFGYGDTRGISEEPEEFDSALVIFFDPPGAPEDPELITFLERRAESR
jgi:hypothetical protein